MRKLESNYNFLYIFHKDKKTFTTILDRVTNWEILWSFNYGVINGRPRDLYLWLYVNQYFASTSILLKLFPSYNWI